MLREVRNLRSCHGMEGGSNGSGDLGVWRRRSAISFGAGDDRNSPRRPRPTASSSQRHAIGALQKGPLSALLLSEKEWRWRDLSPPLILLGPSWSKLYLVLLEVLLCSTMERIGVRELRQHASRYLARVATGETIEVTDRGRSVALLVPTHQDRWLDLVATGQVVAAAIEGNVVDEAPDDYGIDASAQLAAMRDDE